MHMYADIYIYVDMFVCLFVCWNQSRKTVLCLCGGREVKPLGMITHGHRHSFRASDKDSGTDQVHVNWWLTPYKLTGWLASLDLRQPYTRRILSHRTASPHALFDVLVLDRGRGKTMSDLVGRDCELPANLTKLHTANLFHPVTLVLLSPCRDTRLGYHSTTQQ